MLKFYRPHGEQLLLATTYLRMKGSPIEDVLQGARNFPTNTPQHQEVLNNARRGFKMAHAGQHWLDDVIKQLFEALSADANGRGESDLIDQIVRVLQMPYGRNILTGDRIRALRSAILLPSEQAGLTHRLRQREMSCSQCGIALHNEESVTLVVSPNDSSQSIVCHRCHAPHSVPCASCAETASLSTKAMNAMSRMQCPTCQEAKTPKKAPPSPGDAEVTPAPDTPSPWSALRSRTGGVIRATQPTVRMTDGPVDWTDRTTIGIGGGTLVGNGG